MVSDESFGTSCVCGGQMQAGMMAAALCLEAGETNFGVLESPYNGYNRLFFLNPASLQPSEMYLKMSFFFFFKIQMFLINYLPFDFSTYPSEPPGKGQLGTTFICVLELDLVILGRGRGAGAAGGRSLSRVFRGLFLQLSLGQLRGACSRLVSGQ